MLLRSVSLVALLSLVACTTSSNVNPTTTGADPVIAPPGGEPAPGATDPPSTPPEGFAPVANVGLVTVQHRSLMGAPERSTMTVTADGAWSRTERAPASGKLTAEQLSALRKLVAEVAAAKPSSEQGIPCDALPMHASRVLLQGRELDWAGPCAGPPPPESAAVLARYLDQIADGRPEGELAQTLAQPR